MKLTHFFTSFASARLFADKYQITPATATVDLIGFGATIELIESDDCQACNGNEYSLLIGAPRAPGGGAIHFATVDGFDQVKTHHVHIDCGDGESFVGCLKGKMNPVLETESGSIGAVMKMVDNDLWVCDDRMKSKARCRESYYDRGSGWNDVRQSEQKCYAKPKWSNADGNTDNLIERDFFIGGCYIIEDFTNALDDILINKPLDLDNILYYNPCFTYNSDGELMALNYVDGQGMENVPGSRLADGYYNLNCQFGSSLNIMRGNASASRSDEKYDRLLIGAVGQHQQGNVFKINRRKLNKHGPTASGLDKTLSLVTGGMLEYSTPDYDLVSQIDEEPTRNFHQSEHANSRAGSELNVIRLGNTDYILDTAINAVNAEHRKTGCVTMLKREPNSLTIKGKDIASLQLSTSGLVSGRDRVCGVLSHESFGHSILVVDIDGDGRDDLVIGAPRYSFIPDAEKSSQRPQLDIGRIVILLQTADNQLDDVNQIEIRGVDLHGQFGFKIEAAGDLNNDNINDVLVSAPYAGWDRRYPDRETGKVYATLGSIKGVFCATDDASSSDNAGFQCLSNSRTNTVITNAKALGSQIKVHQSPRRKIMHVAAADSDVVYGVELNDMHRYETSWAGSGEITTDETGRLQMLTAELCIEYAFVPSQSKPADVYVELAYDERLVPENNEILFKASKRKRKSCSVIKRKLQVHAKSTSICGTDPITLKVTNVRFANDEQDFGLDFGCVNKLPVLEVPLPNSGEPRVTVSIVNNKDTVTATSATREKVRYDIQVNVEDEEHLRHPYLLVDYSSAEAQIDRTSIETENWEVTACPGVNSACGVAEYPDRKCLRKNLGVSLSKDVGTIAETLIMVLRPSGATKSIDVNVQLYSCSSCSKVTLICDGDGRNDKCTSIVNVAADTLIKKKDIKVRLDKNRIEYSLEGSNEVIDDASIEIEYTTKITGATPVEPGAFRVTFDFPGFPPAKWLSNPCSTDSGVTILPNIMSASCPRFSEGKDGFTIETVNTETINSAAFGGSLKIAIRLTPAENTCTQGELTLNMTAMTTVEHALYDDSWSAESDKKPYQLDGAKCVAQASIGPALWALVGITSAFLILGTVFACYRRNQTNVTKHGAEVKNKESEQNEQSIQYSGTTLTRTHE